MDERDCWIGFSVCPGIGPKRFSLLLSTFGTARAAWEAPKQALIPLLGNVQVEKLIAFRASFNVALYKEQLQKKDVRVLSVTDPRYPSLLRQIESPPFLLYVKGSTDFTPESTIGIVGTRKITAYGRFVTEMISADLSDAGWTIVSGLAMGVDTVAHSITLDHRGKTIAVLGCGVDCCTPASNQSLYNSIVATGGAIVSEFPLGMLPTKGSFPSRNRIIAGMSQAIVVTEGAEDSGALITAEQALRFGRRVFAVPGPITSGLSKGPNKLLAEGAKLVTSADDVLKTMGLQAGIKKKRKQIKGDTKEEQVIIDLLENESLHFDEVVKRTGNSSSEVSITLSLLEVKGIIVVDDAVYMLKAV